MSKRYAISDTNNTNSRVIAISKLIPFLFLIIQLVSCNNDKASGAPLTTKTMGLESHGVYRLSSDKEFITTSGFGLPAGIEVRIMKQLDQRIILGSESHGLYISDVEKTHWNVFDEKWKDSKIVDIAFDDEGSIYISVFRDGIYRKEKNTDHWEALHLSLPDKRVKQILVENDMLILGTDSGIFRSNKKNLLWEQVFDQCQVVSIVNFKGKLFAGSVLGVLQSEDNATTWSFSDEHGTVSRLHAYNEVLFSNYLHGDVCMSTNMGIDWSCAFYSPKTNSYIYDMAKHKGAYYMTNNYGVFRSKDGVDWTLLYSKTTEIYFQLLSIGDELFLGSR